MVALHSITDPSLVPPGKHGLMLETRYTPYAPRGAKWTEEAAEKEASRLLALFEEYAPGVSRMVEQVRPISPPDMERDVLLPKGNFMHADMTIDLMFDSRPAKGLLDGYRVRSVDGLYLCGAGTFPGGAISGVPGRNAALQIISSLRPR
jgi:phytoene dehydrogenase-like protein